MPIALAAQSVLFVSFITFRDGGFPKHLFYFVFSFHQEKKITGNFQGELEILCWLFLFVLFVWSLGLLQWRKTWGVTLIEENFKLLHTFIWDSHQVASVVQVNSHIPAALSDFWETEGQKHDVWYSPKMTQQLNGSQVNLTPKPKFSSLIPHYFSKCKSKVLSPICVFTRHLHLLGSNRTWWLKGQALESGCLCDPEQVACLLCASFLHLYKG